MTCPDKDSTSWVATSDCISTRTEAPSSCSGHKRSWQEAKRRRDSNWQTQRTKLVQTAVNLMAPPHSLCQVCGEAEVNGIIRCHSCGPHKLFCHNCFHKCHMNSRLHCPEIWKGITFVPYDARCGTWSCSDGHRCETIREKVMHVFDQNGRQHIVTIEVCQCEDVLITLLRYQLWAASPKNPTVAIHLQLMEWARVLQIEAHVSTKKFVDSLAARSSMNSMTSSYISKVSAYRAIVKDSMEDYRHFHEQLKGSAYIGDLATLDDGTRCPPCHGTLENNKLVRIDGNFGLVRKKSSGSSSGPSKYQGRVFLKREEVDAFVSEKLNLSTSRQGQSCSNYQVGSALRSKGKGLKLDEKGVIGSACHHEFPLLFCSLRHGETFAYPAFLIKEILQLPQLEKSIVTVAYDVACQRQGHLQDHYPELPHERLQLAIPVFHANGNKLLCQVTKSLRVTSNVGLADGETLERLWSYLRLFGPMTKEMSASKRTDLLTDALFHHSRKERQKLGHTLRQRLDRAEKVQAEAEQEISGLAKALSFNEGTVERWYNQDVHILQQNGQSSAHLSAAEEYAVKLSSFYLDQDDAEAAQDVVHLELKHGFHRENWNVESLLYTSTLKQAVSKHRENLLQKLRLEAFDRKFLISCLRKYGIGQAVSSRIGQHISQSTKRLRKDIARYNQLSHCMSDNVLPRDVSFEDVSNPESALFANVGQHLTNVDNVPVTVQRTILAAWHKQKRAKEEKHIVEKDIESSFNFLTAEHHKIIELLQKETRNVQQHHGCSSDQVDLSLLSESSFPGYTAFLFHKLFAIEKELDCFCTVLHLDRQVYKPASVFIDDLLQAHFESNPEIPLVEDALGLVEELSDEADVKEILSSFAIDTESGVVQLNGSNFDNTLIIFDTLFCTKRVCSADEYCLLVCILHDFVPFIFGVSSLGIIRTEAYTEVVILCYRFHLLSAVPTVVI